MASITRPAPENVALRTCPVCMAPPQVFRGTDHKGDLWCIVCPDCGFQIIGKRVEGLALAGRDLVEVTKPGDDFYEMVEMWNNPKKAEEPKAAAAGKG